MIASCPYGNKQHADVCSPGGLGPDGTVRASGGSHPGSGCHQRAADLHQHPLLIKAQHAVASAGDGKSFHATTLDPSAATGQLHGQLLTDGTHMWEQELPAPVQGMRRCTSAAILAGSPAQVLGNHARRDSGHTRPGGAHLREGSGSAPSRWQCRTRRSSHPHGTRHPSRTCRTGTEHRSASENKQRAAAQTDYLSVSWQIHNGQHGALLLMPGNFLITACSQICHQIRVPAARLNVPGVRQQADRQGLKLKAEHILQWVAGCTGPHLEAASYTLK